MPGYKPVVRRFEVRGGQLEGGLAYVNDFSNGMWIVKVEPRPAPVP
jgi:hypothetical protein